MKNILSVFLLSLCSIGFSQTKIYEISNAKFIDWYELSDGSILIYPNKTKSILEISSNGTKIQEYEYNHVSKNTISLGAEFITSPDLKYKYVINPYMISHDNGHILSQLKDGKSIEVFSQLEKNYSFGNIIDVFADNDNIYVHSSEIVDKKKTFSLFAINHSTLKISEIAKNYFTEPEIDRPSDAGGVYIGQNANSLFFNFANKPSQEKPELINTIRQINKVDGSIKEYTINVETRNSEDIPLFFDYEYESNDYPNHLRLSKKYFVGSSSSYSTNYYLNSERGHFEVKNDTITMIGLISSAIDKKDNITLKEFYSITLPLNSKQQTTITKLNDFTLFCPKVNSAYPNYSFHIEQLGNKIFFERSSSDNKSKTSTFLSGDYSNNKLTNISFIESTDKNENIDRYELLGIDTKKFDKVKIDLGNQANPTVFKTYENKSFVFYSLK